MKNLAKLADSYLAVWNEPDPERRRAMVRDLWTEDASHLLQPPVDIKDSAAAIGMDAILEIRGHQALERRIAKA